MLRSDNRLYLFHSFFALVLLAIGAPSLAHAQSGGGGEEEEAEPIPIEELMREIQARRDRADVEVGNPKSSDAATSLWPACLDETKPPPYPPDGFYLTSMEASPTFAIDLVEYVQGEFYKLQVGTPLYSGYVQEKYHDLDSMNVDVNSIPIDFNYAKETLPETEAEGPMGTDDLWDVEVTASNQREIVDKLLTNVRVLTHRDALITSHDLANWEERWGDCDVITTGCLDLNDPALDREDNSCTTALGEAIDVAECCWDLDTWGDNGTQVEQIIVTEQISILDIGDPPYACIYTIRVGRAQIEFDNQNHIAIAHVYVQFTEDNPDDVGNPENFSPIPLELLRKFGEAESQQSWNSGTKYPEVSSFSELVTLDQCPGNFSAPSTYTLTVKLDRGIVLYEYMFDTESQEGECGVTDSDAGTEEANKEPDTDEDGDGSSGSGGPGGGGGPADPEAPCDSENGAGGHAADADGDGEVSFDEALDYVRAQNPLASEAEIQEKAKELYKSLRPEKDHELFPVHLPTGHKAEADTDIHVRVPGPDFTISRGYTSKTDHDNAGLVGNNWTLSTFAIMAANAQATSTTTPTEVYLYDVHSSRRIVFKETSTSGVYETGGAHAQYVEIISRTIGTDTVYFYRLHEPGYWYKDFYADHFDNPSWVDGKEGLLDEERRSYGATTANPDAHLAKYEYVEYGTVSRLRAVHLNGTSGGAGGSDASIYFDWHVVYKDSMGMDVNSVPTGAKGRLAAIRVVRYDSQGIGYTTQRVDYLYEDRASSDLGVEGDLIQVTKRIMVDESEAGEAYWPKVCQYRYHTGGTRTSFPDAIDERYGTHGEAGQLKAVFMPEQVEYFAQQWAAGAGTDPLEDALIAGAEKLRTLDDDDVLPFDGTLVALDAASKVIHYETSGSHRVIRQYIQSSCGCSGSTQGIKLGYTYITQSSGTEHSVHIDEYNYDAGYSTVYRSRYYDMDQVTTGNTAQYIVSKAIRDPGPGMNGRTWVWGYDINSDGQTEKVFTPASIATYTKASSGAAASFTVNGTSTGGLVYGFTFNADNRVAKMYVSDGDQAIGSMTLVSENVYPSNPSSLAVTEAAQLPTQIKRYRDETSTAADDIELIKFEYGFHGGDPNGDRGDIAWMKIIEERELQAENGPDTAEEIVTWMFYNELGQLEWTIAPDKAFSYTKHDQRHGKVIMSVANADRGGSIGLYPAFDAADYDSPTGVPSGDRHSEGGHLISYVAYDVLGRVIETTDVGGTKSFVRRVMKQHTAQLTGAGGRPELLYYATVSLPHELTSGEYNGPIGEAILNADGDAIRSMSYTVDSADYTSGVPTTALVDGSNTPLSRSESEQELTGLVESRRVWHDLGATLATNGSYVSSYEYDARGRTSTTTDANGSISRLNYDVLDRILSTEVGTDAGSSGDMTEIAVMFYDGETTSRDTVGNSNVTKTITYDGELVGGRETEITYDFRDRPIRVTNPLAPHSATAYDNLDRVTESAVFTSIAGTTTPATTTGRVRYIEMSYSQRGLPYRSRTAIDPSQSLPSFLKSYSWFDQNGRVIASWGANLPGVKVNYDGLGRRKAISVTDRKGDADPGALGNLTDASSLTGDLVVSQTKATYDSENRIKLKTTLERPHDASDSTATGELSSADSVPTYVGFIYDAADRRIATINYGSISDVLEAGANAPTVPTTVPSSVNGETQLLTRTTYNERGLVDTATAPRAYDNNETNTSTFVTKIGYDDMHRRTWTIENFDDMVSDWSISFNSTSGRWEVDGLDPGTPDTNRVTSFLYDGVGNVTHMYAHVPGASANTEVVQETEYVYGVTKVTSSPGVMDSLVASERLLAEVRYPTESTGAAGTTDAYKVKYAYNALGELKGMTDQNGTVHEYERDDLGRVIADKVPTFGSGTGFTIDNTVKAIGINFDTAGRPDRITSYSDLNMTTEVNEVRMSYTPLWQLEHLDQNPIGEVTYSAGKVQNGKRITYEYANSAANNYSRPTAMKLPTGRDVEYKYSGTINNAISRLSAIDVDPLPTGMVADGIVTYDYLGLGRVAVVDYPSADVQLDRTYAHDGTRNAAGHSGHGSGTWGGGKYPGWDRFGRVIRHAWVDGSTTQQAFGQPYHGTVPTAPPIFELEHTYDANSNRLTRMDGRPNVKQPAASYFDPLGVTLHSTDRDRRYTYDGLDRLTQEDFGHFTPGTTPTWNWGGNSVKWSLDMLGNWSKLEFDGDADGIFSEAGDDPADQERNHNLANELTDGDLPGGDGLPWGPPLLDSQEMIDDSLGYDDAGNVFEAPTLAAGDYKFTHDAWNRLVKVELDDGTSTSTVGEYSYNGLHWRVTKLAERGSPLNTQVRRMYYSATWQLVEEDVDDDYSTSFTADYTTNYFWGIRYIDDIVASWTDKDLAGTSPDPTPPDDPWTYYCTDTQFSVVALLTSSAELRERIRYDAYGVARHSWPGDLDGDGAITTNEPSYIQLASLATYDTAFGHDIGDDGYQAEADLDRDGQIDTDDLTFLLNFTDASNTRAALEQGLLSDIGGLDQVVGYAGYLYNPEIGLYTVRFRHYAPGLGRWTQCDPLGYVDGSLLYEYAQSTPLMLVDSLGLCVESCIEGDCNVFMAPDRDDPFKFRLLFTLNTMGETIEIRSDGELDPDKLSPKLTPEELAEAAFDELGETLAKRLARQTLWGMLKSMAKRTGVAADVMGNMSSWLVDSARVDIEVIVDSYDIARCVNGKYVYSTKRNKSIYFNDLAQRSIKAMVGGNDGKGVVERKNFDTGVQNTMKEANRKLSILLGNDPSFHRSKVMSAIRRAEDCFKKEK